MADRLTSTNAVFFKGILLYPTEMSTERRYQELQFDLETSEGQTGRVALHKDNQFIVPTDQIQFVISHNHVMRKYKILEDDITRITSYWKRNVPMKEVFEGFNCVVLHIDRFWRAIVQSVPRVDVVKCFLIDNGVIALVHAKNVFPLLHETWTVFEQRVLTCRLEGLSAFSNSFHLLHILKNQIDWEGDLTMTVIKGGVNPTVIVRNSTYPNDTLNQVILNYLYFAYDPRRLLQQHQRWPDTLITSNYGNGKVDIQLDTPLLRHLQEKLKVTSDRIPWMYMIKTNVVYLGIFGNASEYQRCKLSATPKDSGDESEPSYNLELTFIDTGVKKRLSEDYQFNLIETLPKYPAVTRIPPLAAQVQFNNLESIPARFLDDAIRNRLRLTIEQVETRREREKIPLVEVFEQLPGELLYLNQIFLEALDPSTKPHHGFSYRHFSSLHNWSMPLLGNNWGKGSKRVFDLVEGTGIYGIVTVIDDSPGYFYIRPLEVKPLPRLERGTPLLETMCGCFRGGDFYRVKKKEADNKNVRCRVMDSTSPANFPHMSDEMKEVKFPVYFVDQGTFGEVSPLHLRKVDEKSALVPPQVALAQLAPRGREKWTEDAWKNFGRVAVGGIFHMEIQTVSRKETDGNLVLSVKILSRVTGSEIPPIPESEQTEEEC